MHSASAHANAESTENLVPGSTLTVEEVWWRDQGDLLLKHGYELRARYKPGWKPSWTGTKKDPYRCEDAWWIRHPMTIDAKRISDGKRVKIKRLVKGSKELEIARFLSSDELRADPMNHCVPVLDVISEDGDRLEFMVMPLLCKFDFPRFSTVDEVLDFMKQMLEGLVFMHSKRVAHRDCSDLNIMMEADKLFPKGFHPSTPRLDASAKLARPRRRRDVGGVRYYFTDFGISTRFDETGKSQLVTGVDGQDQDVPELHRSKPYDPFAVDVFILGNLFRNNFLSVYENFRFLEPVVEDMLQKDPAKRPTARDALKRFNEVLECQPPRTLRWALIFDDGTKLERLIWSISSWKHEVALTVKSYLRSSPRLV